MGCAVEGFWGSSAQVSSESPMSMISGTVGRLGISGALFAACGAVGDWGFRSPVPERHSAAGAGMAYPGTSWECAQPEALGVDGAKLETAVVWLDTALRPLGKRALVLVRKGRVIWADGPVETPQGVKSVTKTFTGTVLGLLMEEGLCDLETSVADILPELGESYGRVKLRHFATMTSGYRAAGDEARGAYTHGPSRTPLLPDTQPLFQPPGSRFAYWDSAMNQFSHLLTEIAKESLYDRFNRKIAVPVGISSTGWRWGDLGSKGGVRVNGGAGNLEADVEISAQDLARIGHLFLNGGRWKGTQLLSPDWIRAATRVQVDSKLKYAEEDPRWKGAGTYGLNWWVNGVNRHGKRKLPGAPAATFFASGFQSRCFVIPEWEMVVVCLGADLPGGDERWGVFLSQVGNALGE